MAVGGAIQAAPFLDITARVLSGGERGLLGLAFHPNYESNGRFFVYYTAAGSGANTLVRYQVSANPNVASTAEVILFSFADRAGNHNGATLAFGPDSYLYVSISDEGGGGDTFVNAQNLGAPFGKILRLDVDASQGGKNYAIPPNNPFVNQPGRLPEIWAFGLRNPYRTSFDRATGDLWIADVGDGAFEEINFQRAGSAGGRNYGWSCMEGLQVFTDSTPDPARTPTPAGLIPPIAEYSHAENTPGQGDINCDSVTGGYVYRGNAAPGLVGWYLFGDFCTGQIWGVHSRGRNRWEIYRLLDTSLRISSFGEDEPGKQYLVHHGGSVFRVSGAAVLPSNPVNRETPLPGQPVPALPGRR